MSAVKKQESSEAVLEEVDTDSVENILNVEQSLRSVVVGRTNEIRAMSLAFITKQHIMMEGEPGIAKTKLAKEFADHIEDSDFKLFKTQLTRGMVSDQLLGPTSLSKLRTEDTYCHNTRGMLPDCHVAILDEVYRGPEMLLPVILSILNEREFHNGATPQHCPLITAVGTTNFTTDTDELKAFHDRWLINCAVTPLKSAEERLEMLSRSLAVRPPRKATISLTDIAALQSDCLKVTISREILQLYDGLTQKIRGVGKGKMRFHITDRRTVYALRLAQASAVLNKRNKVTPDDLAVVEYGLICKGLPEEETVFADAFTAEIGNFQTLQKEAEDIATLTQIRDKFFGSYDDIHKRTPPDKDRLAKLQKYLREVTKEYRGRNYIVPSNASEFARIYKDLETLLSDVSTDVSK